MEHPRVETFAQESRSNDFFLRTFLLANVQIDKFQNVSDGHISAQKNVLVGKEGATECKR